VSITSPKHARRSDSSGVEGNTRFTAGLAVVLLVTLFLEGLTILRIRSSFDWHVRLGFVLIPITLFKIGTTGWRIIRYYSGSPEYVKKGPPPILLRLLGPIVIVLTLVVLFSGVGLVVGTPTSWHSQLFSLHRISFVLWFGAMAIHVLGHLVDTAREAPRDWYRSTRRAVSGATTRQLLEATSIVLGVILAIWLTPYSAHYFVTNSFVNH
jgi:hypothetical protein